MAVRLNLVTLPIFLHLLGLITSITEMIPGIPCIFTQATLVSKKKHVHTFLYRVYQTIGTLKMI